MSTITLDKSKMTFDTTKYKYIGWLGSDIHMVRNLVSNVRELWGYDKLGRKSRKKLLVDKN
jgi:hypothetical protein